MTLVLPAGEESADKDDVDLLAHVLHKHSSVERLNRRVQDTQAWSHVVGTEFSKAAVEGQHQLDVPVVRILRIDDH